jgi:photosystem II stability/assembly factor-like uncharacterized protein
MFFNNMEKCVATVKRFCGLLSMVAVLLVAVGNAWASEDQTNGGPITWKWGTSSATTVVAAQLTASGMTISTSVAWLYAVTPTATVAWDIGQGRTGNGYAYIDFHGDATYSDYGFRVLRGNAGPNDSTVFYHRGTGALVVDTVESTAIVFGTTNTERMRITAAGLVGIGTAVPTTWLDVSGTIYSRAVNAGAATSINWASGNEQYTSANCGAFTFSNMQDGGQYTLAIQGQGGGTCSFTHSGLTVDMADNGQQPLNTDVVYSFRRIGSTLYVMPPEVYKTTATCYDLTTATPTYPTASVFFYYITSSADGMKLAAAGGSTGLILSTDGGASWTAQTAPGGSNLLLKIASSADGTKLVTGGYFNPGSKIYTSTDSGATWTARDSSRNWSAFASSSDGVKLAATAYNGYVYTSTDSGVTWTARTASGSRTWYALASSADGTKLVAGPAITAGNLYVSTDSGATWTARATSSSWLDLAGSADGSKWIAVRKAAIPMLSTDSGTTWSTISVPSDDYNGAAMSSDGTKIIVVSKNQFVMSSTDGGSTWTPRGTVDKNWYAPAMSSDGSHVVIGMYDQIEVDNGQSSIAKLPSYVFTCP